MKPNTRKLVRRLVALCLGLGILAVLLHTVGWRDLSAALRAANPSLVALAFCLFVPQVVVIAWRWQLVVSTARPLGFWDSMRMVLAGSALNVILPSKLGDICRGFMISGKDGTGVADGLGLAALDKLTSALGLAAVMVVVGFFAPKSELWVRAFWLATLGGLVVSLAALHLMPRIERLPQAKPLAGLVRAMNAAVDVRRHRTAWAATLGLSVLLWVVHVGQIFIFYRAVGGQAPPAVAWSRVPMGIFIGLLPLTVAGIGTRDAAFFALLVAWDAKSVIAWLGLFCTLRYVVMAVLGVPAIVSLGPTVTSAFRSRAQTESPPPDGSA